MWSLCEQACKLKFLVFLFCFAFSIPPDSLLWDGLPEDSSLRQLPDKLCDILLLARSATQDLISLRDLERHLERHLDEFEEWLFDADS